MFDYIPLADGIVRNVPLWAEHRGHAFPQMGLALACAMLDVHPKDLRVTDHSITIPRRGGDIVIPVYSAETPVGRCGMFMDIPWFGRSGTGKWETMYDYPSFQDSRQHMTIGPRLVRLRPGRPHRTQQRRDRQRPSSSCCRRSTCPRPFNCCRTRRNRQTCRLARPLRNTRSIRLKRDGTIEFYRAIDPGDLTSPEDKTKREKMLRSPDALRELIAQSRGIQDDLAKRRSELRSQLQGHAVLIGYIAVGAMADEVPTSLHPRCPGVVLHGAIFNSIMTGEFWYRTARWITLAITLAMGPDRNRRRRATVGRQIDDDLPRARRWIPAVQRALPVRLPQPDRRHDRPP